MFCFYIFVVYNCKRLTFNQNTIFMKTAKLKVIAEPLPTYPIPEFVIGLRHKGEPMQDRHKISGSRDVFDLMKKVFNSDSIDWVESFVVMCMNRANKPIGFYKVSAGGVSGTVADPKVIFQVALLCNASGIIVAHNHPSGNLTASQADIALTKKLKEAGKVLEIQLLDHLILMGGGETNKYFSFADEGLI